jgi:hypothetical protein
MILPPLLSIVEVHWKDHFEPAGDAWWERETTLKLKAHINQTVGYFVGETEDGDCLIITSSLAGPDQFNRPLVLLKCCVTVLHVLSRVKSK